MLEEQSKHKQHMYMCGYSSVLLSVTCHIYLAQVHKHYIDTSYKLHQFSTKFSGENYYTEDVCVLWFCYITYTVQIP